MFIMCVNGVNDALWMMESGLGPAKTHQVNWQPQIQRIVNSLSWTHVTVWSIANRVNWVALLWRFEWAMSYGINTGLSFRKTQRIHAHSCAFLLINKSIRSHQRNKKKWSWARRGGGMSGEQWLRVDVFFPPLHLSKFAVLGVPIYLHILMKAPTRFT
jgi:hypothetical protein